MNRNLINNLLELWEVEYYTLRENQITENRFNRYVKNLSKELYS